MEFGEQDSYKGSTHVKGKGRKQHGQREDSNCDVGPGKALANPMGSPGASSAYGGSCIEPSYVYLIRQCRLLPEGV